MLQSQARAPETARPRSPMRRPFPNPSATEALETNDDEWWFNGSRNIFLNEAGEQRTRSPSLLFKDGGLWSRP